MRDSTFFGSSWRLTRFFKERHLREGVEVFTAALSHGGVGSPTALRAEAIGVLGDIMEGPERRRHLEEGLAITQISQQPGVDGAIAHAGRRGTPIKKATWQDAPSLLKKRWRSPGFSKTPDFSAVRSVRVAEPLSFEDPSKARVANEEAITSGRLVGDRETGV